MTNKKELYEGFMRREAERKRIGLARNMETFKCNEKRAKCAGYDCDEVDGLRYDELKFEHHTRGLETEFYLFCKAHLRCGCNMCKYCLRGMIYTEKRIREGETPKSETLESETPKSETLTGEAPIV